MPNRPNQQEYEHMCCTINSEVKMKNRRVKEHEREDRKSKSSTDTISIVERRKDPPIQLSTNLPAPTNAVPIATTQHYQDKTPLKLQKQRKRRKQLLSVNMAASKMNGSLTSSEEETQRSSRSRSTLKLSKDNAKTVKRTLEVCSRAVDGGSCQARGRKRTRLSRERSDIRETKVKKVMEKNPDLSGKISVPSTPEANLKVSFCTAIKEDCQSTSVNPPSTRYIEDSPVISGVQSDMETTSLNRSFQLDALNMGYSNSPKLPESSAVKPCSAQKLDISLADIGKKMLRIKAPVYSCASNDPGIGNLDKRTRKTVKRRSAKRQLREKIQSSPGQSLLEINRPGMFNLGLTRSLRVSTDAVKRDVSSSDTRIWFSSSLQIDTMSSDCHGGIKKDYNRADLVCVTHSSFRPQSTLSSYPDAINTRVTYDKDGKVVVLEVMGSITSGIYRVLHTRVSVPHQSITRGVAMETLLVRCSAIKNVKPHSQYLVLSELHRIPKRQWREKISATVVRLRMEDFLHTCNFHTFALPLLLWNGEKDNWSWAKDPTKKFHTKRKPEDVSRKSTENKKSKSAPILIAPKITSLPVEVANTANDVAKSSSHSE